MNQGIETDLVKGKKQALNPEDPRVREIEELEVNDSHEWNGECASLRNRPQQ